MNFISFFHIQLQLATSAVLAISFLNLDFRFSIVRLSASNNQPMARTCTVGYMHTGHPSERIRIMGNAIIDGCRSHHLHVKNKQVQNGSMWNCHLNLHFQWKTIENLLYRLTPYITVTFCKKFELNYLTCVQYYSRHLFHILHVLYRLD